LAAVLDPSLTTIAQTFEEMGRVAVTTLVGMIANADRPAQAPTNKLLPTRLIVRASTAPVLLHATT